MTEDDSGQSPLRTATAGDRPPTVDAFELLSNDTRLAILLALWEAYDPLAPQETVSFSELRHAVGMRDSGQFNYHLGKLSGRFVEHTDRGYRLRRVGVKLVQTVIADGGESAAFPLTEVDVDCSRCGSATGITYRDGWLYHLCTACEGGFGHTEGYPEGALFGVPMAPTVLTNRSAEAVFAAGVFRLLVEITMKMGGLCPRCSGSMSTSLTVCEDHSTSPGEVCDACGTTSAVRVQWVCSVCKYRGSSSPAAVVVVHPAVTGFYHDHGVDVGYPSTGFEAGKQVLDRLRSHEQELVSTDPLRVQVTVRYDDAKLRVTMDEGMAVVAIERDD